MQYKSKYLLCKKKRYVLFLGEKFVTVESCHPFSYRQFWRTFYKIGSYTIHYIHLHVFAYDGLKSCMIEYSQIFHMLFHKIFKKIRWVVTTNDVMVSLHGTQISSKILQRLSKRLRLLWQPIEMLHNVQKLAKNGVPYICILDITVVHWWYLL